MPAYIYTFASPLFHLTIMIERVLATVYVKIYEKQGKLFGVISTIIVWTLTLIFVIYVYISSIIDVETFGRPMVYYVLTSIYNAQMLVDIHLFYLFLVIIIAITDYYLIKRNKKIKSNFSIAFYNLSQSYQAKQNILVMKIIFPLDFSYTFVFTIYNILSSIIRAKREEYGQLVYVRAFDIIILVI
uniref:Serpentine receptor class gamma n=1 Tax=Meloidogyne javanica TaxID=6303 RepID=A0A915MFY4_MELJA